MRITKRFVFNRGTLTFFLQLSGHDTYHYNCHSFSPLNLFDGWFLPRTSSHVTHLYYTHASNMLLAYRNKLNRKRGVWRVLSFVLCGWSTEQRTCQPPFLFKYLTLHVVFTIYKCSRNTLNEDIFGHLILKGKLPFVKMPSI